MWRALSMVWPYGPDGSPYTARVLANPQAERICTLDDSAPRKDSNQPSTRGTRMGHAIGLLAIGEGLIMRRDQRARSRVPTSHLAIGATGVRSTRGEVV